MTNASDRAVNDVEFAIPFFIDLTQLQTVAKVEMESDIVFPQFQLGDERLKLGFAINVSVATQ